MSGKSELLTLTPLISARFYLRPGFFDPVASKGFTSAVSLLFATLAERAISVAAKGLTGWGVGVGDKAGEHAAQSSRLGILGTHPAVFARVPNKGLRGYGTWKSA